MGLFDKKFCDICGNKIGLMGNRKLEDGNMCKNCAALLSPFMTDRRRTTQDDIKDHLAYREANKAEVAALNVTRTLGDRTKVMLDEDNRKFIVTSSNRWQGENPDVISFSQVTGCMTDIHETKTEIKMKDREGKEVSYVPPRYKLEYDYYVIINVNSPWFSEIKLQVNRNRMERGSIDYRECDRLANELKRALTQVRQEARDKTLAVNAPKVAQTCLNCGATTIPDARGCCEFCGGVV